MSPVLQTHGLVRRFGGFVATTTSISRSRPAPGTP